MVNHQYVVTWQDGDIAKLQADLKIFESHAVERELELERNAWMQVMMMVLPLT